MVEPLPKTDLSSSFSSPGAQPTPWAEGRRCLADAEVYWLSSVRPDGRPHVTPLLGVWSDGALCFCTGSTERKARNLAANPNCTLTTGSNTLDGLDLVVEGPAVVVTDLDQLGTIADAYEGKYGPHFEAPDGNWAGLGDSMRTREVEVYRVAPTVAFGFVKREPFSQTRWSFPGSGRS